MKKLKLFFAFICIFALYFFGFVPCFLEVNADTLETSEIVAESGIISSDNAEDEEMDESSETFENAPLDESFKEDVEAITLPAICGVVGLSGCGLIYFLFSGKLGKIKEAFDTIVSWFTKKKEDISNEESGLKCLEEKFLAAVSSNQEVKQLLEKAYKANKEEYEAFKIVIGESIKTAVGMVEEMKTCYESRADIMEKQYLQIKEILIKMVTGSAELVRKGISDEVVKLLETNAITQEEKE